MFLDDNKLTRGLRAAEAKVKAFGSAVAGVGAGLLGAGVALGTPFIAAAKVFADTGSELADMSARTGASVESLSALGHAATQTGASLGDVETGLRKMQKGLVDAATGSSEAQVAFRALGLDVGRLMKLAPDEQFAAVAEAIASIRDPTAKAAAAMQVFGKSGTALLPLIDDLDALVAEAQARGFIFSTEDAEAADTLGDAIDNVWKGLKRITLAIGAALAPELTAVATTITDVVVAVADWVDQNRPLIATIFRVAVALVAGGAALVALGAAITGVGAVLGTIAAGFGVVGSILGAVLSPIGLITVALVAGVAAFLRYTEAGQQALDWLGGAFASLQETATTAFGGIADALRAGDIRLAGEILWAALEVLWLQGTDQLREIWADFGVATVEVFRGISYRLAGFFIDAWAGIQAGFVQAVAFLRDAFTGFINFVKRGFIGLGGFFAKVYERIKALFTGEEVEGKLKEIDAATNKSIAEVQAGTDATIRGREEERDKQLAGIEQTRQAAQSALADQQQAEVDARRAAAQAGVAAGKEELAAAQQRLKDLAARAAEKRAALPGKKGEEKKEGPPGPEDLGLGLQRAAEKVDVKGTFSAAALRGMGVGETIQNDQLKEQKKTNDLLTKQTKKIEETKAVYT